jgi:hypothetical protein
MRIQPKRIRESRFVRSAPVASRGVEPGGSRPLDLAVVAYENADVLEEQARLLADRLTDEHEYMVFDNSPSEAGRRRISALCEARGIAYVGLPDNPFSGRDPSASHGLALNWAYERVLRERGSPSLGVIDPDVFPARETSVLTELSDAPCWGHLQTRGERWYLWAGFAFFSRAASARLDFMPRDGLDTGGGNWRVLFRHLDRSRLSFPAHSYVDAGAPGRSPERIGDWVHTFNSSSWRES